MMSGQRDASMMSRSEGGGGESAGAMKRPMRKQSRSEHTPLPSSTSAPPSSPAPSSIPTPNSKPKSAHAGPSTSKSSPMMLSPPSLAVIAPTPEGSPGGSLRGSASPVADSSSNGALAMPPPSEKSIGKRKADDLETTPPKTAEKEGKKGHRATFALDTPSRERTSHRASESAHAPSAYSSPSRKRPRMSSASPNTTPSHSRPGSAGREGSHSSTSRTYHNQNLQPPSTPTPQRTRSAASSRSSPPSQQHHRSQSEKDPPTPTRTSVDRRRSLSAASMTIPMSAIITPHAPSVTRSNNPGSLYHMRDPRKSPRIQETGWSLRFRDRDGGEEGSGLHAWAFFVGFLIFPLWWVVSWFGVPTTRRLEGGDAEKRVVVVDDPQIEHDAKVWRFRCRVAAVLSFFTYIPFIILIAIFVSRKV
ncbi:hypothetical protein JAAARDRAFT_170246 [Jaapia argillacea MUCL 33604]|uniref:Uncharacterized protein n=1 Tax=Jaapia argillacea MUCL 33604 TaxID=933084 RepID=A0A067Q526_9AGAM|nr:hypothetical protein JAAARDRAFT_170246 [Jaapia argillacea MUCL 33604]